MLNNSKMSKEDEEALRAGLAGRGPSMGASAVPLQRSMAHGASDARDASSAALPVGGDDISRGAGVLSSAMRPLEPSTQAVGAEVGGPRKEFTFGGAPLEAEEAPQPMEEDGLDFSDFVGADTLLDDEDSESPAAVPDGYALTRSTLRFRPSGRSAAQLRQSLEEQTRAAGMAAVVQPRPSRWCMRVTCFHQHCRAELDVRMMREGSGALLAEFTRCNGDGEAFHTLYRRVAAALREDLVDQQQQIVDNQARAAPAPACSLRLPCGAEDMAMRSAIIQSLRRLLERGDDNTAVEEACRIAACLADDQDSRAALLDSGIVERLLHVVESNEFTEDAVRCAATASAAVGRDVQGSELPGASPVRRAFLHGERPGAGDKAPRSGRPLRCPRARESVEQLAGVVASLAGPVQ